MAPLTGSSCSRSTGVGRVGCAARGRISALAWLTSAAFLAGARTWWDGPHPADFGGSVARAVAAEGGPTWGPDHADLTEESLAEAHALGLRVVPWTVNRPADMRRLIRWGVDGLITDRPDLARAVCWPRQDFRCRRHGGLRKLAVG